MNFIKLSILLGISFAINLMISDSSKIWISNSHQNVNRNISINGELPNAYRVKILFHDDNYLHTHSFNGGVYQINVEVNGSTDYLSTRKLNQIDCNLNCSINSPNHSLSGNVNIKRTITVLGEKDESEMREMLRNNIVEIILQEIQKI